MANEMRLIDANALSEKIGNMKSEITHKRGGYRYCNEDEKNEWDKLDSFDSLVCDAPTVDAVEVVHAHWTTLYTVDTWMGTSKIDCFVCSECGKSSKNRGNYCTNCGAKMDGGNEDG